MSEQSLSVTANGKPVEVVGVACNTLKLILLAQALGVGQGKGPSDYVCQEWLRGALTEGAIRSHWRTLEETLKPATKRDKRKDAFYRVEVVPSGYDLTAAAGCKALLKSCTITPKQHDDFAGALIAREPGAEQISLPPAGQPATPLRFSVVPPNEEDISNLQARSTEYIDENIRSFRNDLYVSRPELEKQVSQYLGMETLKGTSDHSHPRMINIYGPGGAGKTQLALECASKSSNLFPGGIYFVPLAKKQEGDINNSKNDGSDVSDFARNILRAMDRNTENINPENRLIEILQTQDETLLVLDNFESVNTENGHVI